MQWEELTAPEFAEAVKDTGVCVLSTGCLEKHFDHLPLGTDYLNAHKICSLAAAKEPAVVFPPYYFGQIHEAKCFPGAVAVDPVLTLQLLMNVCDEIGRNGFSKIVILNGHGGNSFVLHYLCQTVLSARKPYVIFLPDPVSADRQEKWDQILETPVHGHACECETSITLANHEDLVKMDAIAGRKADPLGRLDHLPRGRVTISWYANYPDHYAGEAEAASVEKGKKLRSLMVDSLADYIRLVKNDETALDLMKEFYDRCDNVAD